MPLPTNGMFNQTTRRDPRYSGRRALNYRSMGGSTSGAAPAPAISEFIAAPVGASANGGGTGFQTSIGSGGNDAASVGVNDDTATGFDGVQGPVPDQNMNEAVGISPNADTATEGNANTAPDPATGVSPGEAPGVGAVGNDGTSGVGTSADAAAANGASDAQGGVGSDSAGDGTGGGDGSGGGGGDGGGGGCFISEATMAAGGQGDNDPTLQTLRQFRDQVMMANPVGQAMVQEYEMIAPIVVEAVSQRPDAMQIFAAIKQQFLDKAVESIQQGDMNAAFQTYAEMMAFVTPFAVEAELGTGGDPDDRVQPGQEAVDDFGDMAAMAAYNPEMGHAATGGMEMDDPMNSGVDAEDPGMAGLPPQPAGMPGYPGGPVGGGEPAIGQFVRRY